MHGLRTRVPAERCETGHRPDSLYSAEGIVERSIFGLGFCCGARLKAAFQIPIASPIAHRIVSYRSGPGGRLDSGLGRLDRAEQHSTRVPDSSPPA
jgi:hypothetical protein